MHIVSMKWKRRDNLGFFEHRYMILVKQGKHFYLPTYVLFRHGYRDDDDHHHQDFHGHSSYIQSTFLLCLWCKQNPRKSHKIFIEILSKSQSFVQYGVLEREHSSQKKCHADATAIFKFSLFLPCHKQYSLSQEDKKELCWSFSQVLTETVSTLKFKTCGLSLAFLVFNKPKIISGRVVMVAAAVCAFLSLSHSQPIGKNASCLEFEEEGKSMSEFSHECTSLQPSLLVSTENYIAC